MNYEAFSMSPNDCPYCREATDVFIRHVFQLQECRIYHNHGNWQQSDDTTESNQSLCERQSAPRDFWGPFLERPGNLTGPKSYFEIKVSRKVRRILTYNEVHFVCLADNFTVQLSNLLKLPSGMENKTS